MLDLFPKTGSLVVPMPSLQVNRDNHNDTYKSLFMGDLIALNLAAKRCIQPGHYFKQPNGDTNLSLADITLDTSSFYLFAHKALASSIFIFTKLLPHDKQQGISYKSVTTFVNDVQAQKTTTHSGVRTACGRGLTWALKAIVEKRDDLVQHWQGNRSNQFFLEICAWDVPLVIYYDPLKETEIDKERVDSVYSMVKSSVNAKLDSSAQTLQKIAWMEAWQPKLSSQLAAEVETLLDNSKFIALPVTPQLLAKLDDTMASLLEHGLAQNKLASTGSYHHPNAQRAKRQ